MVSMPIVRKALRSAPWKSACCSAKAARWRALRSHEADFLLLAQHRDDQAETLLLQLLRGAGPAGTRGW